MAYRITIYRTNGTEQIDTESLVQRVYEQTVDELDMRAVMSAVNKRPRKSRAKSKQDEAGK